MNAATATESRITRDSLLARANELLTAGQALRAKMQAMALAAAESGDNAALVRAEADLTLNARERAAVDAALRAFDQRKEAEEVEARAEEVEAMGAAVPDVVGAVRAAWTAYRDASRRSRESLEVLRAACGEAQRLARDLHLANGGRLEDAAPGEHAVGLQYQTGVVAALLWEQTAHGDFEPNRPLGTPADAFKGLQTALDRAEVDLVALAERTAKRIREREEGPDDHF